MQSEGEKAPVVLSAVSLYAAKHDNSKSLLVMSQGADGDRILQTGVPQPSVTATSISSLLPNLWKAQIKVFSFGCKQRAKAKVVHLKVFIQSQLPPTTTN